MVIQGPIHDCSTLEPSGWDQGNLDGSMSTASDATAPISPSGIIDETMPMGMEGGVQAAYCETVHPTAKKSLRVQGAVKWSNNYKGHPGGNNKLVQDYSDSTNPGNFTIFELFGDGSEASEPPGNNNGTEFFPGFVLQGGEDMAIVSAVPVVRDAWWQFDFRIENNDLGSANGKIDLWVNTGSGWQLALQRTGLRLVADGRGDALHKSMTFGSLWGGFAGVFLSADQHCYWDHIDVQLADLISEFAAPEGGGGGGGGSVGPNTRARGCALMQSLLSI